MNQAQRNAAHWKEHAELKQRLKAAEAQRDTLAEALRKIANTDPVTGRKIARAALAGAAPPETETSVESYETGEGMTDVEFYGR